MSAGASSTPPLVRRHAEKIYSFNADHQQTFDTAIEFAKLKPKPPPSRAKPSHRKAETIGAKRKYQDADDNCTCLDCDSEILQSSPVDNEAIYYEELRVCGCNSSDTNDKKVKYLRYLTASFVEERLRRLKDDGGLDDVPMALDASCDLIPGRYEGGLKVWECTKDLVKYINERINNRLIDKQVLDLGCGVGLVGIICLQFKAKVHFHDYNREVINLATIPNNWINFRFMNKSDLQSSTWNASFYAGDWTLFCGLLGQLPEDEKYDFIFTSETIYNQANYGALVYIFKNCIKQQGEIYVAAKSVYFGVGGTIGSFKSFCESSGYFEIDDCWTTIDGVKREILRLKPMKVALKDCYLRKSYRPPNDPFTEHDLVSKEAMGQFAEWFEQAKSDSSILQPNAMCLATSTKSGVPSARMVLLKGYGKRGFEFFTNYNSRKGIELIENPKASLVFYWEPHDRQVRVEGYVEKMSVEDSEKYFHERPRQSQISAAVSEQSSIIKRDDLLKLYQAMCTEHNDENVPIPKPEAWGGFRVVPEVVEFFQGQTNRLHDRIRFRKLNLDEEPDDEYIHRGEDGWIYERLAP